MSTARMTKARPASYDAILRAAITEFAEHGRDGVRVERVARRAQVNKSLVYRHFKNREKLFDAALGSVFTARFMLLENLPPELEEILFVWSRRFGQSPDFIKMILREALEHKGKTPIHADVRRTYYQQQISAVKEFQRLGELPRSADPECLFLMLLAVLVMPHLLPQIAALVTGDSPRTAAFQARWKKLLRMLLGRLRSNSTE